MKKGFSIIEMVLCLLFSSLIILSITNILLSINDSFNQDYSNNIETHQIMLINNIMNNCFENNEIEVILKDNKIMIDDVIICIYENNILKIYEDNNEIFSAYLDEFNLTMYNNNLFKINYEIGQTALEKYYYIGGDVNYES